MSEVTRPLLRWHGGKWVLFPWIDSQFPAHRCYVEPYGGGGSVLLRKRRSYAEVYNDMDGELVNLFTCARDCGPELQRLLELTPFARTEFELAHEETPIPIERARRTVIRAYMGFGSNSVVKASGFRANSNKSGATPAHDWHNLPAAYAAITERLRGVVIEHRDALQVMAAHDSVDTLHYVDPPYPFSTRTYGKGGYRFEMTDDEHRTLATFLKGLKGAVVLSGYPCALYDEELYSDWERVDRVAMADGARERTEVLWMRNIKHDLFTLDPAATRKADPAEPNP